MSGISHSWNGTVLTITSDSGTSSCDLKGEKGDDGVRGAQGAGIATEEQVKEAVAAYIEENGGSIEGEQGADGGYYIPTVDASGNLSWTATEEDMPPIETVNIKGERGIQGVQGTSISKVEQTTTSTADNGVNIVTTTLSNGKQSTISIRNGSQGSRGAQGQTGAQGVGIASITQAEGNPNGGRNTITITLTDGTKKTLYTYNGSKGDKGDKGDTGEAGSGGGGAFYIDLIGDEETGYSTTTTMEEVGIAYESGMSIFCRIIFADLPMIAPMIVYTDGVALFSAMAQEIVITIVIMDGSIEILPMQYTSYEEFSSHNGDYNSHITAIERNKWNNKANKATTLSGYGITDAATKTDLEAKLDRSQGVENAGKILMVDANGNLTLTDMPEVGMSGDIVGVVSENNEIVLTGVLPEGLYTINYEMEDGTIVEVGSLNLESEQVVPITLTLGKIDYNNNGAIVASDTYLYSDAIEKEANKTYTVSLVGSGAACNVRICYYDANDNYIGISENVLYTPDNYTIVTGAWNIPLISECKKFRLRVYHAEKTYVAATLQNLVLTKQNINYTNLLPLATDASGNVLESCGYKDNYRMSNYPADFTKDTSGTTGYFTTGLIPYTITQTTDREAIYIKGIDIDLTNLSQYQYLRFSLCNPNEPSVWRGNVTITDITNISQFHISKLGDKYYLFRPNANVKFVNEWNKADLTHMRLTLPGTGSGVIITVNEPIE